MAFTTHVASELYSHVKHAVRNCEKETFYPPGFDWIILGYDDIV